MGIGRYQDVADADSSRSQRRTEVGNKGTIQSVFFIPTSLSAAFAGKGQPCQPAAAIAQTAEPAAELAHDVGVCRLAAPPAAKAAASSHYNSPGVKPSNKVLTENPGLRSTTAHTVKAVTACSTKSIAEKASSGSNRAVPAGNMARRVAGMTHMAISQLGQARAQEQKPSYEALHAQVQYVQSKLHSEQEQHKLTKLQLHQQQQYSNAVEARVRHEREQHDTTQLQMQMQLDQEQQAHSVTKTRLQVCEEELQEAADALRTSMQEQWQADAELQHGRPTAEYKQALQQVTVNLEAAKQLYKEQTAQLKQCIHECDSLKRQLAASRASAREFAGPTAQPGNNGQVSPATAWFVSEEAIEAHVQSRLEGLAAWYQQRERQADELLTLVYEGRQRDRAQADEEYKVLYQHCEGQRQCLLDTQAQLQSAMQQLQAEGETACRLRELLPGTQLTEALEQQSASSTASDGLQATSSLDGVAVLSTWGDSTTQASSSSGSGSCNGNDNGSGDGSSTRSWFGFYSPRQSAFSVPVASPSC